MIQIFRDQMADFNLKALTPILLYVGLKVPDLPDESNLRQGRLLVECQEKLALEVFF